MELAEDILLSDGWMRLNQLLVLVSYLAGFGALVFAAAFARATEPSSSSPTEAPWPLVVGALRDSFLVTMLYLSESLFLQLAGFAQSAAAAYGANGSVLIWVAPMASGPLSLLATLLAVYVAGRRLLILSRWLRALA